MMFPVDMHIQTHPEHNYKRNLCKRQQAAYKSHVKIPGPEWAKAWKQSWRMHMPPSQSYSSCNRKHAWEQIYIIKVFWNCFWGCVCCVLVHVHACTMYSMCWTPMHLVRVQIHGIGSLFYLYMCSRGGTQVARFLWHVPWQLSHLTSYFLIRESNQLKGKGRFLTHSLTFGVKINLKCLIINQNTHGKSHLCKSISSSPTVCLNILWALET